MPCDQAELERALLETALLRVSELERRVARVEFLALRASAPDDRRPEGHPMTDQAAPPPTPILMPTGWRANRAVASLLSVHTLLLAIGALLLGLASLPQLAAYATLLQYAAGLFGVSGLKAATDFKTPAEQAMINQVKIAGMLATSPGASSGPTTIVGLRALLPLLFLAMLSTTGCAGAKVWAACTLGQLPQVAQPAIPTIVVALSQDDTTAAVSALEQIGMGLLPGQVGCIVKAVQADEAARAQLVMGERTHQSVNLMRNAAEFLLHHPAHACRDAVRVIGLGALSFEHGMSEGARTLRLGLLILPATFDKVKAQTWRDEHAWQRSLSPAWTDASAPGDRAGEWVPMNPPADAGAL